MIAISNYITYIDWFLEYDIEKFHWNQDDYCEIIDHILWMNENLFRIK